MTGRCVRHAAVVLTTAAELGHPDAFVRAGDRAHRRDRRHMRAAVVPRQQHQRSSSVVHSCSSQVVRAGWPRCFSHRLVDRSTCRSTTRAAESCANTSHRVVHLCSSPALQPSGSLLILCRSQLAVFACNAKLGSRAHEHGASSEPSDRVRLRYRPSRRSHVQTLRTEAFARDLRIIV